MSRADARTSYHVDEQLRIRRSSITSVRGAWRRGDRLDIPDESPVPEHDEARYDARADVVIFRREDTLVTAYGLLPEYITTIYGVAVAAAVDAQYQTSYLADIDAANLEEMG
ncbi:hypothetical protein [Haloparvum sedimenti]|uniref:hypothetical protein n=1 Tax=Haloparvum sedimenti TaxID=1678448 RepID=UPI00071E7D20|nr:hypothetical protein [Haloparvum sedimenti]